MNIIIECCLFDSIRLLKYLRECKLTIENTHIHSVLSSVKCDVNTSLYSVDTVLLIFEKKNCGKINYKN